MEKQYELDGFVYKSKGAKFWLEGVCQSPKLLYKYYGLNSNSIDSILSNTLWGADPSQFNDPFDFHEKLIDIDDEGCIQRLINDDDKYTEWRNNLSRQRFEWSVQVLLTERTYQNLGVISMTSNPNNLLMWSYYGGNKGFQVCFDWDLFDFSYRGPFPLNYQEKIKPIKVSAYGLPLCVLYQSNVKYSGWGHEREWRFLAEKVGDLNSNSKNNLNRKFSYPMSSIKYVALGARFFERSELTERRTEILIKLRTAEGNEQLKEDELRMKLLDFLVENNVQVDYCLYRNLTDFKIEYITGMLERVNEKEYLYKYLPISDD